MSQYNQQASSLALAAPSTIFQAILQPDEKWALHCHKSDIASKVNLTLVEIMTLTIEIINYRDVHHQDGFYLFYKKKRP